MNMLQEERAIRKQIECLIKRADQIKASRLASDAEMLSREAELAKKRGRNEQRKDNLNQKGE